jgi:hypothetical protein
MNDTLRMLFVELMTGTAWLEVMSTSEVSTVAFESYAANGIKDRKLVLVAREQSSKKLDAAATGNRPVVRLGTNKLIRVAIARDIQRVGDDGASTASDHVEALMNDASNYRCC